MPEFWPVFWTTAFAMASVVLIVLAACVALLSLMTIQQVANAAISAFGSNIGKILYVATFLAFLGIVAFLVIGFAAAGIEKVFS